jgi:hypothetical protein
VFEVLDELLLLWLKKLQPYEDKGYNKQKTTAYRIGKPGRDGQACLCNCVLAIH